MKNDFAIGGGLENCSPGFEFRAEGGRIDNVSIVRDGDGPADRVGDQGLGIGQSAGAAGRVTDMADCAIAFEPRERIGIENLRDEAHGTMDIETVSGPLTRDDSGTFLPAMLQGKQTIIRQECRVFVAEDAEDAAFMPGCRVVVIQSRRKLSREM